MPASSLTPRKAPTLARVLSYLSRHGIGLMGSAVLSACVVVSTLLVPVLSGQAIDCATGAGGVDAARLLMTLQGLALAVATTSLCQWLLTALTNRIAYDVVLDMRAQAFAKISRLPMSYIDAHPHGDIVNRIVTDVDQFSNGLIMTFQQFLTGILTIVITLAFMLSLNVWVTLVVICITPLSVLAAKFIAARGFSYFHDQSTQRGALAAAAEEYVTGRSVVEAFDAQDIAQGAFEEVNERLRRASFKAVFFSALIMPTTRFVNSVLYAAVGGFGSLCVLGGSLSVGGLTAFLSYANQYTKPFNDISEVVTELQNSLACAQRLFDLLEEDEQAPDAEDARELGMVEGRVTIDDVSFSYDLNKPLIEDFSLDVHPGMRVAIVGPTGCGKTTMINLLMRFYDVSSGHIEVDGHDVRDVTRDSLRKSWGMVLQDTWVKSATVRDNIAFGKPEATLEEVRAAARQAFADDFIMRLPKGYDTMLGGEEATISAGQRQLLCIARAMLADAPMLILDEATSNIDTMTEQRVQTAFERLMRGRTSFVVAHRLSTIKGADLIVAMRDGHIVEKGTHEELLAKGGFYAHLYNSQYAD